MHIATRDIVGCDCTMGMTYLVPLQVRWTIVTYSHTNDHEPPNLDTFCPSFPIMQHCITMQWYISASVTALISNSVKPLINNYRNRMY